MDIIFSKYMMNIFLFYDVYQNIGITKFEKIFSPNKQYVSHLPFWKYNHFMQKFSVFNSEKSA